MPACLAVGTACGGSPAGHGRLARATVHRHAVHDGVCARPGQIRLRRNEGFDRGARIADGTYRYVDVPPLFRATSIIRILGGNLSVVTVIFLICVALAWLALARHRWGRYLYAIGGNEEAARLSGVPVVGAKICAYAASGLFAAVAGLCQAAQEQQGDPEAGAGYELIAIAMVVIGGTSLMGGRGGIGLTLLGVLTIGYLDKILSINAVPEAGRLVLTGVIIVAAVLTQRRSRTEFKIKTYAQTHHAGSSWQRPRRFSSSACGQSKDETEESPRFGNTSSACRNATWANRGACR